VTENWLKTPEEGVITGVLRNGLMRFSPSITSVPESPGENEVFERVLMSG